MRRAFVCLAFLAACSKQAPPPQCAAEPRVVTIKELEPFYRCEDDACRAEVRKNLDGAYLSVSAMFDDYGKAGRDALAELEALRDFACACKDQACAEKATADFDAWAQKYADTKGTQEQSDQAAKIAGDIQECVYKFAPEDDGGDDEDEDY